MFILMFYLCELHDRHHPSKRNVSLCLDAFTQVSYCLSSLHTLASSPGQDSREPWGEAMHTSKVVTRPFCLRHFCSTCLWKQTSSLYNILLLFLYVVNVTYTIFGQNSDIYIIIIKWRCLCHLLWLSWRFNENIVNINKGYFQE